MTHATALADVLPHARTGDVLAFGGKGAVSRAIQVATRSPVSHVGVVVAGEADPVVIESTTLDGLQGVAATPLSPRVATYPGRVWWLPLSERTRLHLDVDQLAGFLRSQLGRAYDRRQVLQFAWRCVPLLRHLCQREDLDRLFCSELIAAAFEHAGLLDCNASLVSPVQLCRWRLYRDCFQVQGSRCDIAGVNSLTPPWRTARKEAS